MKAEIRDYILDALSKYASLFVRVLPNPLGAERITKKGHVAMSYVHFTRDIELVHHVTMVGWTAERFCNPSDLSNSIDELVKLRDALKDGTCRFVPLTDEEYEEVKKKYDEHVQNGLLPPRKKRKDAGTKRKKAGSVREEVEEEEAEDGEHGSTAKRVRVEDVQAASTSG